MFHKIFLAAAVIGAGLFVTQTEASAHGDCYHDYRYGAYYRPSVRVPRYSPNVSHYRSYRPSYHSYYGPGYGFGPRRGYFRSYSLGYPYGGHSYYGYGGGFSIGIGF